MSRVRSGFRVLSTFGLLSWVLSCPVFAQEPVFTTSQALTAKSRYDRAVQQANMRYMQDLESALQLAIRTADLAEVAAIQAEMNALRSAEGVVPPPSAASTPPHASGASDLELGEGRVQSLGSFSPEPQPERSYRSAQDSTRFTSVERREIERLYQEGNRLRREGKGRESIAMYQSLIETYPESNRAGCTVLYLAHGASGRQKEEYYRRAISEYSDCRYGDGVVVGAFARFSLANIYAQGGRRREAVELFNEMRRDYPDAIDHGRNRLDERIPQAFRQRAPSTAATARIRRSSELIALPDGSMSGIRRGSTREEVEAMLGEPDRIAHNGQLWDYNQRFGIGFWTIDNRVHEVRLNMSFLGGTAEGVRIGSTGSEVFATYGNPLRTAETGNLLQQTDDKVLFRNGNLARIVYHERRLLLWFRDARVVQIIFW